MELEYVDLGDILAFVRHLEDMHRIARGSCNIIINSNGSFMVRTFSLRVLTSGSKEDLEARIAKMIKELK